MHTRDYIKLFSADGGARAAFKKASPGAEAWVDDFCDGLVERLSLQDRLEEKPQANVNLWLLVNEGRWQVNVDVRAEHAWNVETGDDLLLNLVNRLK